MTVELHDYLVTLAAQLRAAADTVETVAKVLEGECPHPKDQRKDVSVLGTREWRCMRCEKEFPYDEEKNDERSAEGGPVLDGAERRTGGSEGGGGTFGPPG
jgi:tRNA(Ile2) C34 agmatinyltransferase TiaS